MNVAHLLVQEFYDSLPFECRLVLELSQALNVPDNYVAVYFAAFRWYYVPLSRERRAYAKRVLKSALKKYKTALQHPDWLIRVYELKCIGKPSTNESIPPPPDPAY